MTTNTGKTIVGGVPEERCDTRIWSGECQRDDFATGGEEYLCTSCGTLRYLDHEVRHEIFPYVSGDTDNLS
jgi:5-methylcytosine-specific restriction endonuclease McrA